jgi:general secretion pathway protein D
MPIVVDQQIVLDLISRDLMTIVLDLISRHLMARPTIGFVDSLSEVRGRSPWMWSWVVTVRSRVKSSLHGWGLVEFPRACVGASIFLVLGGCVTSNVTPTAGVAPADAMDSVRNTDFSPRFPVANDGDSGRTSKSSQPFLFPGSDVAADPQRDRDPDMRTASLQTASLQTASLQTGSLQQPAFLRGDGVEMNFEGADVQTVAKALLGDILQLNFVVDPRVQGNVTLASSGPIPRKDVLPAFESVLRMSNAAIVRSGNLVKIVPIPEAGSGGVISVGVGEPGFGVSLVPLRYTSASTVAKTAESFLARPGAIRVVPSRNLLLIQGTTAERQAALDVVATFDVEWLQNQSVGVYPLKSTSPETMIGELERVFETSEGGLGQGVVRFQPISRMNAVMVVTKNPKLLNQATQWVQRLDRSDTTGTTLRTFRLKNGNATQVAKILNDIFGQRSGTADSATKQIAPGVESAQSRIDSLDRGSSSGNGATTASGSSDNRGAGPITAAFESFSDRKSGEPDSSGSSSAIPRGTFQNLRITADAANNSIVVYSNQEDYRVVERALRDIDRPQLQVAIDATVAEVTLTDALQFGVQFFLNNQNVSGGVLGAGAASNVSGVAAASATAQSVLLQSVGPGVNLLLGSAGSPRAILNALQTVTEVKVLSSPSIVALDNQPALLQVGDEIPITTSSAVVLSSASTTSTPIVNTIQMRNTGVILKVLPHVHSNGSVQLEVDQEISNVVNADQPTLTPTIAQRRVHSTVSVVSGQTVLLAGLISERSQKTQSGIPGLREIKFIGDLFGNTSNTKTRSEIIIFIKTKLIQNPVDAGAVTEEFRERLQSMRGGRSVVDGTMVQKR